jgi:glycosyltransferase involved in cell wall biosynthesis
MSPRVSIITTVFDRVACLRRCLRSVQHLQFADCEQIVVSDAPPAPVVQQIAALVAESPRIHTYINLPTRKNDWGISPAAAGLSAATGEFVCFLSDDNAFLPNHFGPLIAALDADARLGFAYSSCLYAGRKELRYAPPRGAGIDLGQPLFRRSVLKEHLGDTLPFTAFAWDWELIDLLMRNGVRWQHVDEATFIFRLAAYPQHMATLA